MKKIIFAVMLGVATLGILSCKKDEMVLPVEELVSFEVIRAHSQVVPVGDSVYAEFRFIARVESKVDILIPRMLNEGSMIELVSNTGELPERWERNLFIDSDRENDDLYLINAGEKTELIYTIYVYSSEKSSVLYARIRGLQYFFTGEDKSLKGITFDRDDNRYRSPSIFY